MTPEELLLLHYKNTQLYGGVHGVKDVLCLPGLSSAAQTVVYGQDVYPTIYDKTAAYLCSLMRAAPFVDNNLRTATTAAAIFLGRNKMCLTATSDELTAFVVEADNEQLGVPIIAAWLRAHSRAV